MGRECPAPGFDPLPRVSGPSRTLAQSRCPLVCSRYPLTREGDVCPQQAPFVRMQASAVPAIPKASLPPPFPWLGLSARPLSATCPVGFPPQPVQRHIRSATVPAQRYRLPYGIAPPGCWRRAQRLDAHIIHSPPDAPSPPVGR